MPRGNPENLIPSTMRSEEEHRRIARNGGIASGEARRAKRDAKAAAKIILESVLNDDKIKGSLQQMGVKENEINIQTGILASMAKEGMKGNVRAAEYLINLGEDASASDKNNAYTGLPARIIGKDSTDINRDIDDRRHRHYDFAGGRGSLKSSFCAEKEIDLIEQNPNFCGLAIRQVKDTLKDSVYSQLVWAIDELGLTDQYKCTENPLSITKKSTGQKIYFRGADDPMKIKSIKPPKGMHIGVIWIEEADQLRGANSLRNILQSAMRGGEDILVFRSYNTPRSQNHFINKEAREKRKDRIVHHSHFMNAPREWLGTPFYEEAEYLKSINEQAYRHEYDGEAVGTGGNVFENVIVEAITDEQINTFDRLYYGLDFGWYPDPNAFVELYYNASERKLYIFGEIKRNKTKNLEMAELLNKWKDVRITADNKSGKSDDKDIADFRSYGFNMRGAIKGPGSVDYSIKWLQSLTAIVIDDVRCPNAAEEFLTYEYERDKDGEIISGYPDKDNHFIDATRYAMEEVWRRKGR